MDYSVWKKSKFRLFFEPMFFCSKKASFPSQPSKNPFYWSILHKKLRLKISISWQSLSTNPFQKNANFGGFLSRCFLWSKKASFPLETSKNTFFIHFAEKLKLKKSPFFDKNHGLTSLKKWKFWVVFWVDVFLL